MAEEMVKLHGNWSSPSMHHVMWALKIKGVKYEYIEEDLSNKSPLLLKLNPFHKNIPVLVHGGNVVCDSAIIIEYIDEVWPQNSLLPSDAYARAVARFWVKYILEKAECTVWKIFHAIGDELEKIKKETEEFLLTVEEHCFKGDQKKHCGGDRIGVVDIVLSGVLYWLEVAEATVGEKLFHHHKFPRLHVCFNNFKEVTIVKQSLPDWDKLVLFYKHSRSEISVSSSHHYHHK